jgi:hypothetical protein
MRDGLPENLRPVRTLRTVDPSARCTVRLYHCLFPVANGSLLRRVAGCAEAETHSAAEEE